MAENLIPINEIITAPDRLPPQNVEAEQSVLGALMMDRESFIKIADVLHSGDFYRGSHNIIFSAMVDLYEKGEPIDLLSVTSRLEERGVLENAGGISYLTQLVNSVPTSSHIVHYASIVHKKKILRALIEVSYEISQLGYQETEDVDHLLDEAEQKIFKISQHTLGQRFDPVKDTLGEAFERIEKLHQGEGRLRGTPTGFSDLDNHLAGLQKSDLIILAARPSTGKTSLALDIARHVGAKAKLPIGIFSLEMSRHDIIDRFIAADAGIDLWRLRTGRLHSEGTGNDFEKLQEAITSLSEAPIYIDDSATLNVMQMRTMARRLKTEHKDLSLLVVDYLQLISPKNSRDPVVQQVTEISRALKGLARELEVPILALSQLSRAVESRPDMVPRLSDLRESGSIEQDADVVMFIHREDRVKRDTEKTNIASIMIAKHRNGPIGQVELYFNESQASFKTLAKQYEEYNESFAS